MSRRYERLFYKLDGYGYLPHERTHIWIIDARNGRAKQLTDDAVYDELEPSWSPDGKWIAFTGQYDGNTEVYLMPAEGGTRLYFFMTVSTGRCAGVAAAGWRQLPEAEQFRTAHCFPWFPCPRERW